MKSFLVVVICTIFIPSICISQVKQSNIVGFETADWFSVWTQGNLFYQVSSDEVFVRISNGVIEKNPLEKHRNYNPWLATIHVSLSQRFYSERRDRHTWKTPFDSEKIKIEQPVPQPGEKIDISCLQEIQCFEFSIKIPEELDLSEYWITITLTNPKGHVWHAHNNFYKTSFSTGSQ